MFDMNIIILSNVMLLATNNITECRGCLPTIVIGPWNKAREDSKEMIHVALLFDIVTGPLINTVQN